jgi:aminomethyltransferase
LKHTSLFACHVRAGAAMVPFAGWEMPISYKGTVAEVAAVRAGVGLFDVSHMGEARVIGPGAETFLQRVTANDVSRLASGQAQYSLLLNEDGGVIDDIIAYHLSADEFLVVLNAGCKDKDWSWLTHHAENSDDITLEDISDQTALIAVQGPEAVTMVRALIGAPDIARFHAHRVLGRVESCDYLAQGTQAKMVLRFFARGMRRKNSGRCSRRKAQFPVVLGRVMCLD